MALIDCKACGGKTAEGLFCEKCRAELPSSLATVDEEAAVLPSEPEAPASEQVSEEDKCVEQPSAQVLNDFEADEESLGLETLGAESTINTVVAPPIIPSMPQDVFPSSSSCAYIHVEHDESRVFVVGQTMNFRFAISPLVDGLSDVFVAIVFEGRGCNVEVKRLGWMPCKGERRVLRNINFAAPEAGSLGFSFYFGFTLDDAEYVFEADGEHKVWPSHTRAKDVVRNLEINIQNSGHAADFQLSGLKDQLRPDEKAEEAIDKLHRMPPVWSGLRLYGSTWRPPRRQQRGDVRQLSPVTLGGMPTSAARLDRLTLRAGGRRIHLFTGDTIRLGKNRQNDVVTRLFEDGQAPAALNSKISRYHCIIERYNKNCYIIDRGDYPGEGSRPSAFGVFIDGERIPARGRRELDMKSTPRLTLAGAVADSPGVFSLELEPWACDSGMRRTCRRDCESRKLGSLVLRRCDATPETYVALWECFSLGTADPDFDGVVVWREGDGYGYATAETDGWLRPGLTIRTPQGEIRVEESNQHGL